MRRYFPNQFKDQSKTEFYNELIKKSKIECRMIYEGISESLMDMVNTHEKNMLIMNKPNIWNVNRVGNMEREMEVEFNKFLYAVAENSNEDIDSMSTFRFYTLIEYIKERNSKNKK